MVGKVRTNHLIILHKTYALCRLLYSHTAFWHFSGSLDGPCRADGKAQPASGLGLRTVRSRIPAHAGHARSGPGTTNSLLRRSCADGGGDRIPHHAEMVGYVSERLFGYRWLARTEEETAYPTTRRWWVCL